MRDPVQHHLCDRALPGIEIGSCAVRVRGDHRRALRVADPPIIARVAEGDTLCDLRTVDPLDDGPLGAALAAVVAADR